MSYVLLCNHCLDVIDGDDAEPIHDGGLFFHQPCWIIHKKEVRDAEGPKVRVLGFVRAVPPRITKPKPNKG